MKRLILICAIFLAGNYVYAEVPKLINYSGKLTDKAGNIVADMTYDMCFSLWNQETGGLKLWSEEHYVAQGRGVQTYGGGFNVILGGTTALPAFDQNYWVEITVTINSTPETFGRQQIISVPYALRANDGTPQGAIIMWTGQTCPVGYRRMKELDGLFPRGAASYFGGHAGGEDMHSHGGNTQDGGVKHTHVVEGVTGQPSSTESPQGNGAQPVAGQFHYHSFSVTSGDASAYLHSHPISADSNVPRYFNVIFCEKE